jgi:uncharacterized lipoprotein YmbA
MKTILSLIAIVLLSGCAIGKPGNHYEQFLASQQRTMPSNPVQEQVTQIGNLQPAARTDAVCMNRCMSQRLAYGLCQKNCSY